MQKESRSEGRLFVAGKDKILCQRFDIKISLPTGITLNNNEKSSLVRVRKNIRKAIGIVSKLLL